MAQTTNKSGKHPFDGQFIDLTDEIDTQNVLNEDDDILILDTKKPMEDLTAEINQKLKTKNKTDKTTVANSQPKKIISKTSTATNLVTEGPTRVRATRKPVPIKPKLWLKVNPPKADLAQKQLNAQLNQQILKTTNSKNVYLLNKANDKLLPVKSNDAQKIQPAKIGNQQSATTPPDPIGNDASEDDEVIVGDSDFVITPSSSEIRNKKFPKDPLSESLSKSGDDDVIFVQSKVAEKGSLETAKSASGVLQKNSDEVSQAQKTSNNLLTTRTLRTIPLSEREKLGEFLGEVSMNPTSNLDAFGRPESTLCDKKRETAVSQSGLKNSTQSQSNLVLNGLNAKIVESKSPISQFVIENVYSTNADPEEIIVSKQKPPGNPPKKIQSPEQKSNDDVICLTDLKEKGAMASNNSLKLKSSPEKQTRKKKAISLSNLMENKLKPFNPVVDFKAEIAANNLFKSRNPLKNQGTVKKALQELLTETKEPIETNRLDLSKTTSASLLSSKSLADIVETASAVANITPNGEVVVDHSKKGNPLIFFLYPMNKESGGGPFKEGQINQVLALVPSGSSLAPPKLMPLTSKDWKQVEESGYVLSSNSENVKAVKPNEIVPRDKVFYKPSLMKDLEIEPVAGVTPVDIMKILNEGKKTEISGRCNNNEVYSGVYFKGFKKIRKPFCGEELKTMIKKEEDKIDVLSRSLKRYETNFVVCGTANYFLPETVKAEIDEIEEVPVDVFEEVGETRVLPTISQVISKVNKEVRELKNKQEQTRIKEVQRDPLNFSRTEQPVNSSRTEEALNLIRKGLEMIQSWSQQPGTTDKPLNKEAAVEKTKRRGRRKKVVETVTEAHSSTPAIKKRRVRRKKGENSDDVILIEDVSELQPVKRRRRTKVEIAQADGEIVKRKRLNVGSVWRMKNSQKNVDTVDNSDDLLVVKRVDIIKSSGSVRGRKRKQTM